MLDRSIFSHPTPSLQQTSASESLMSVFFHMFQKVAWNNNKRNEENIHPLKTSITTDNSSFLIGHTSSNGCFSVVFLVFGGVCFSKLHASQKRLQRKNLYQKESLHHAKNCLQSYRFEKLDTSRYTNDNPSWRLNHHILVKMDHVPTYRGENSKCLKPTPRICQQFKFFPCPALP